MAKRKALTGLEVKGLIYKYVRKVIRCKSCSKQNNVAFSLLCNCLSVMDDDACSRCRDWLLVQVSNRSPHVAEWRQWQHKLLSMQR